MIAFYLLFKWEPVAAFGVVQQMGASIQLKGLANGTDHDLNSASIDFFSEGSEDAPHFQDHYLDSSFQHEMLIPDDMFLEAWMNKKWFEQDLFNQSDGRDYICMHSRVRYIRINPVGLT